MSEDYVGTREAARLLGVSEASVRRWSDDGILASHRVGRRGERRFERSDVLGLRHAGRQGTPSRPSAVFLEGLPIDLHNHLTSFYTTDSGRLRLGLPFLRDGIAAGQACVVVADRETADVYKRELQSERVSVSRALESGMLQVMGPFKTIDEGLDSLERSFSAATRRGGVVIRVLGEAVQVRDAMGSAAWHLDFEVILAPLMARFPVVMLCQYDARRIAGADMVQVLKAHSDNFDKPLGMFLN